MADPQNNEAPGKVFIPEEPYETLPLTNAQLRNLPLHHADPANPAHKRAIDFIASLCKEMKIDPPPGLVIAESDTYFQGLGMKKHVVVTTAFLEADDNALKNLLAHELTHVDHFRQNLDYDEYMENGEERSADRNAAAITGEKGVVAAFHTIANFETLKEYKKSHPETALKPRDVLQGFEHIRDEEVRKELEKIRDKTVWKREDTMHSGGNLEGREREALQSIKKADAHTHDAAEPVKPLPTPPPENQDPKRQR